MFHAVDNRDNRINILYRCNQKDMYTVVDRILEMKKGSRAAVSRKGWGPKTRQKISDITDFPKKELWK